MKEHGIRNPGVRVLTSTGDDLHEPQRRLIEEVFGVGVTDYYGAGGEGMHLASQCERREGYHIHMENSIVEIIRDGRPAKSGEVGSVVVTQLDNRAMPLIRYDLGDLARVGDGSPCACGRAHPVLDSIGGRACDLVYTPAGSVLLPQFFFIGAFKNLRHVARYQVVQEELDRVVVNLVAEEGCDRRACETDIARYLVEASDGSLKVEFAWVSEIPLSGLGKPRPILSKLTETPGLAESVSREN